MNECCVEEKLNFLTANIHNEQRQFLMFKNQMLVKEMVHPEIKILFALVSYSIRHIEYFYGTFIAFLSFSEHNRCEHYCMEKIYSKIPWIK